MKQLLSRDAFREAVFNRDNSKCVVCGDFAAAAHHIIERCLWGDGGYYLDNGVSLCNKHHLEAEQTVITCETLREKAGITIDLLPPQFSPDNTYDKWGNIYIDNGKWIQGPLFNKDQVQRVLKSANILGKFIHWRDVEGIVKYPRTRHVEGSGIQKGDKKDYVSIEEIQGKLLIVEEKIDGANTGISFDNCEIKLQCRGHFLTGGDWPEFDQFKVWANTWQDQLFDLLEDRYILYGEWMSGFHSVYYDLLPHYFMEFDIFDKKRRVFLSTDERHEIIGRSNVPISSVRVLRRKEFYNMGKLHQCIGLSAFISENAYAELERQLTEKNVRGKDVILGLNKDRIMEGLYVKWEENGIVKGRYKYVRPGFVQTILDSGEHWRERASISNKLKEGCSMF